MLCVISPTHRNPARGLNVDPSLVARPEVPIACNRSAHSGICLPPSFVSSVQYQTAATDGHLCDCCCLRTCFVLQADGQSPVVIRSHSHCRSIACMQVHRGQLASATARAAMGSAPWTLPPESPSAVRTLKPCLQPYAAVCRKRSLHPSLRRNALPDSTSRKLHTVSAPGLRLQRIFSRASGIQGARPRVRFVHGYLHV